MEYKFIIFDADETLLDFEKAEECAFEKTMKFFKVAYNKEEHLYSYKDINKKIWNEFERELITAEDLKEERFRRFFNQLHMDLNPKEANKQYINNLCESCFILEGTVDILRELKGKFNLALITNGLVNVQKSRIRSSGIGEYFDTVVISEEIGIAKPNPAIFQYTFEKANHEDKATTLMVGDSLNSDIKGGINFGIDTCWFNPKEIENKTSMKPTYEIHNIYQLKDILFK